jgi:hypothetical protein
MSRAKDRDEDAPGGPEKPRKAPRRKPVPSPDTVVSESTLVSPKGRVYRVLRTNQKDPYDEPVSETPDEAPASSDDRPPRRKGKRRRKS